MSARIFIWVQHLLGLGHYARACTLANALTDTGNTVTLVSGGFTPAGALPRSAFVQLPPARAKDELFDELVDETGKIVTARFHETRRTALLRAFEEARPDIVITETFPFGRRLLNFELHGLIDAARARRDRPLIVASVRDILQRPRKDDRARAMVAYAREHYDAVLSHGDANVARLEHSFAETAALADRTHYTGYLCAKPKQTAGQRTEILVSAGGGAAGRALIDMALAAREHTRLKDRPWTFVTGPLTDGAPSRPPGNKTPGNVTIVRSLPDFRDRLAGAALSISQAGYNTLVESAASATPTIAVPFETDREKEQRMRAERFAARGWIKMLAAHEATPAGLAALAGETADAPLPPPMLDLDGARNSVAILRHLLAER